MLWICAIISTELQSDFKALAPKFKPNAFYL
jgi:hypothetical protein